MEDDRESPVSTGRIACTHEGNSPGAITSELVIGVGLDDGEASVAFESQSGMSVKSASAFVSPRGFSVKAGGADSIGSSMENTGVGCGASLDLNVFNQSGVSEEDEAWLKGSSDGGAS